ncbi:unnamed protein product [Rhizophagus irregularis]|nr:unnamed protein product [Rhizophagus irregularis]
MITDLSVGNIPVLGYVSHGLRDRLNIINRNIQNTQRIFKEDSSTITYDNRLHLKYGEVDLGKLLKRSNL